MNERRVYRRPAARADILDMFEFVADENPDAAYRFLESVRRTEEMLLDMPRMAAASLIGLERFPDMRCRSVAGFRAFSSEVVTGSREENA